MEHSKLFKYEIKDQIAAFREIILEMEVSEGVRNML